ncbi:MAG: DUF4199 domain-containing protein [Bacteroidaceae bacterium]|nr:DUF4199 domain-containing protein [Bacteroidaceae bacterium]
MKKENGLSILRQFIMEYGSIMGISWTAIFALYVIGLRSGNGIFLIIALFGLIALLVQDFYFGIRIKIRTIQLGLTLSPLFTYINIFSMFMYASLICGALEYFYFSLLDHGALVGALQNMMENKATQEMYNQMGMKESYQQARSLITEIGSLSALDKVIILFNQNFFTGMIIAIPVTVANWLYRHKS